MSAEHPASTGCSVESTVSAGNSRLYAFSHLALEIVIFWGAILFQKVSVCCSSFTFCWEHYLASVRNDTATTLYQILVEGLFYLHVKQLLFLLAFLDLNGNLLSSLRIVLDLIKQLKKLRNPLLQFIAAIARVIRLQFFLHC